MSLDEVDGVNRRLQWAQTLNDGIKAGRIADEYSGVNDSPEGLAKSRQDGSARRTRGAQKVPAKRGRLIAFDLRMSRFALMRPYWLLRPQYRSCHAAYRCHLCGE